MTILLFGLSRAFLLAARGLSLCSLRGIFRIRPLSSAADAAEPGEFTILRFTRFKCWPMRQSSSISDKGDGEKVTGRRTCPMGSRSWLFSAGEMGSAALLSPHCFLTPPLAASGVFTICGHRKPEIRIGRGCPRGRRVTHMNKIYTAGLSIVMSRAGDASARSPA